MTDCELLELAAKAADIEIVGYDADVPVIEAGGGNAEWDNGKHWNPLTDDGDALRLAVKLRIPLWFEETAIVAGQTECSGPSWRVEIGVNDLGGYAATRRAIVRAAAEIGKAMP